MNSQNIVILFLEAWKDKDYEAMQDLSADKLDELAFASVDVTAFHVEYVTTIRSSGNRKFYVNIDSANDIHKLSFTVIPKPGPFEDDSDFGVVSKTAISNLPKGEKLVSTNMTAREAVRHIKNTPLENLKGFVSEEENRVTVRDALGSKK